MSNALPMVVCPVCGKESQWDDYYDARVGTTRDCPKCEALIEVVEIDIVTYVRVKAA